MDNRVIVIGRNYSTSLGVIRAMGKAGYSTTIIKSVAKTPKSPTPELVSKYIEKFYCSSGEEEILRCLKKLADKNVKKLVIPTDDVCAAYLDEHYDKLSRYFYLPSLDGQQGKLTQLMDKYAQKSYVRACGLKCAESVVVEVTSDGKFSIPDEVVYPCYTKPLLSIGNPKGYIKRCDTKEELKALLEKVAKNGENRILVEEYLDIEAEYVVPGAAFAAGRSDEGNSAPQSDVIIPALIKKTKIGSGEHKGVTMMGVIAEESDAVSAVRKKLCKLLSDIKMTGLFDIELIYSRGEFYFNELNLRYGAAGYGITAAGVNLPGIYADYMLKGSVPAESKIRPGAGFVSEKVALDDFRAGFSSWSEYKKNLKSAEIRFIRSDDDPAPYKIYKKLEFKSRIRRIVNKIK